MTRVQDLELLLDDPVCHFSSEPRMSVADAAAACRLRRQKVALQHGAVDPLADLDVTTGRDPLPGSFGLPLGSGCGSAVDPKRLHRRRGALLLNHVCEFVREQLLPGSRRRCVSACPEYHVIAYRVGERTHLLRRLRSTRVSMHPHPAEVVAEAAFHEAAGPLVEGLPPRAQYLVHERRNAGRWPRPQPW